MRPVNLIPQEDRRGGKAPLRTGPLSYAIVGVLLLAVGAVTFLVLTGNKISDRKTEVSSLQSQVNAAQAQADQLSTYTSFAELQQARQETVTSLATSRFDWERALHELALVLPSDVWLTDMTASAATDPSSSSSSTSAVDGVTGPSLDINGCASGQDAVAKFVAALRDMDGVTRVSVLSSDRPGAEDSSNSSSSSSSTSSSGQNTVECADRDFIATFEVVAAFDDAPPPVAAAPASPAAPAAPTTTTTPQTTAPTQPQPTGSGGGGPSGGTSASAVVSNGGGSP